MRAGAMGCAAFRQGAGVPIGWRAGGYGLATGGDGVAIGWRWGKPGCYRVSGLFWAHRLPGGLGGVDAKLDILAGVFGAYNANAICSKSICI